MPQDGSNNYQYPPGTPGIPDTTIESEAYNTFLDDLVVNDLNIPRPIHRGGTGANNANNALVNLTGEKATQLVADYGSHVWLPGSFYSAPSATAPPVAGHAFAGICYLNEAFTFPPANANVIVEARDESDTTMPGRVYVRQKKAGVWDTSWSVQAGSIADMDAAYVNTAGDAMTGLLTLSAAPTADLHAATKLYVDGGVDGVTGGLAGKVAKAGDTMTGLLTLSGDPTTSLQAVTKQYVDGGLAGKVAKAGDTMSGTLTISTADPSLSLNKAVGAHANSVLGSVNGVARWILQLGDGSTESGSNSGSNFSLYACKDDGSVNGGPPLVVSRSTGVVQTGSDLHASGSITAGQSGTTGSYYFGNSASRWLSHDGTNFNFVNGQVIAAGIVTTNGALTSRSLGGNAHLIFQNSSATNVGYCYWDVSTNYVNLSSNGPPITIEPSGISTVGVGFRGRGGVAGGVLANVHNFAYDGNIQVWVDTSYFGVIAYQSDYRIKKDVNNLPSTWDTVKNLRPIKYTQSEFSTPSHNEYIAKQTADAKQAAKDNPSAAPREVNTDPLFKADNIERWGFIAHELQETLTTSAATGIKDSHDTIQSPNPWTIIAALTKALQEAMSRIEALEAS